MFFLEKCKEKTFAIVLKDINAFDIKKDEIVFIEKIKYKNKKKICKSIKKDGSCFDVFSDLLKSIDSKLTDLDLDEKDFLEMKEKNNNEQYKKSIPIICEIIKELPNYWYVKMLNEQSHFYIPKNVVSFQIKEELPCFTTIRITPWYYRKMKINL